jgi:TetR/AcrR family transcriptional repressor of lmrAB and yxaGH operons
VLGLDTNVTVVLVYRPIGQMPSREDCRQRIVQTALKLFATRGYYNTSIADILRESDCKRGSLYYYFSSKEELGYAAIDESFRLFIEEGAASRLQTNEHPIDRLHKLLDDLPSSVKLETTGDLTAGVAARMASVHDGFRQRVEQRLNDLADGLVAILRKGVADGQIADSVDPRVLAHVCFIVSQGSQFADLLGQRKIIWEDARGWLKEYLNSLRK